MTFGAVFPRVMRPAFGPGLASATAAANWWEAGGATGCIAAYQPKGASSLAASYVNLANPGTYDAAPGVAPTWASGTGWTFNGSTQYLQSGISGGWDADSHRYNRCIIGAVSGASYPSFFHRIAGVHWSPADGLGIGKYYVSTFQNGNHAGGGTPPAAGVFAINANGDGYLNGAYVATSTTTSTPRTANIVIGASNKGSVVEFFWNGNILALAIYNTTLTAPQVLAVSTAMAAL